MSQPDGPGCAVITQSAVASAQLGIKSGGRWTEAWTVAVAPGGDVLLALAFAVLYEKDRVKQHFNPAAAFGC